MQGEGRLHELLQLRDPPHGRELLEHLLNVFADGGIAGEKAVIGIQTGSLRMVVTRAEMNVPLERSTLATHDENHLGVRLVPDDAVDNMRTRLLQHFGKLDVRLLVEARAQFDDDGHLLALARRIHQRLHHR